ncbi:MAG: hypothetical protein IPJ50_01295 [Betaproteobacteria bacterium]|nr:hypothetical protein [Betaproteobacteria bacterium]
MRHIPFALLLVSAIASAAPPPAEFDQAKFEKRFRAADKNQNGKLSRDEAYAAFPRAPEFFDEIDANLDGSITLGEVKKAADKRVDAAVNASKTGSRYRPPLNRVWLPLLPALGRRSAHRPSQVARKPGATIVTTTTNRLPMSGKQKNCAASRPPMLSPCRRLKNHFEAAGWSGKLNWYCRLSGASVGSHPRPSSS